MTDEGEDSGWTPRWAPARETLNVERPRLLACVGHRIANAWVVWNLEHDEWFADMPVVLGLDDGRQLEVSWKKMDDLSITWNTIDVSVAPTIWTGWPLEWRSSGHESLQAIIGDSINAVAASQYLFTTRQIKPVPSPGEEMHSTWLVSGLWLETDGASLHIFNALDENGLDNGPALVDQAHRVTPL